MLYGLGEVFLHFDSFGVLGWSVASFISIAIAGYLIFLFNYLYSLKKLKIEKNISIKIGLFMGIITAPWFSTLFPSNQLPIFNKINRLFSQTFFQNWIIISASIIAILFGILIFYMVIKSAYNKTNKALKS
jgi:hypothetical protein